MNRVHWHKLGLPFLAGILLLIASFKIWSLPSGEIFASCMLGASLVLIGFASYDWIRYDEHHNDPKDNEEKEQ